MGSFRVTSRTTGCLDRRRSEQASLLSLSAEGAFLAGPCEQEQSSDRCPRAREVSSEEGRYPEEDRRETHVTAPIIGGDTIALSA